MGIIENLYEEIKSIFNKEVKFNLSIEIPKVTKLVYTKCVFPTGQIFTLTARIIEHENHVEIVKLDANNGDLL